MNEYYECEEWRPYYVSTKTVAQRATINKERKIYHRCGRKIRHESYQSALIHLKDLEQKDGDNGLNIYLCRYCGGFHVGHKNGQ